MLKQQIIEQSQLENKIYLQMRDIFNKIMSSGIITPEYYTKPISSTDHGWTYSDYNVNGHTVHITGSKYVGRGNVDYAYIDIDLDQIDNMNDWISAQQEKLKIAEQEKLIAEQTEELREAEEQKIRDREQYEALKKKFELEKRNDIE